jgi:hypothetical protein
MASASRVVSCLPRRKSRGEGAVKASPAFTLDVFADEIHLPHITNQMKFARVFLKVAQREYDSGCVLAGRRAETTAAAALAEAEQFLSELRIPERSLLSADLDALHLAFANLIRSTNDA